MFRHLRERTRGRSLPQFGVPLRLNRRHPLYSSIVACLVPDWGLGATRGIDLVTGERSSNPSWPTPAATYTANGDGAFMAGIRYVFSSDAKLRPTGAYTISSLVQTRGGVSGTGFQPFVGLWDPDYNGGVILGRAYSTDYYLKGGFWNGTAWQSGDTTTNVLDGYLHGHAQTYNGVDLLAGYKNGTVINTAAASGSIVYAGTPRLWFMCNQFDSNYINAESPIGIVLNRCLGDAEIAALHAAHMAVVEPDFGDVAYYFDVGGAGTTHNATGTLTAAGSQIATANLRAVGAANLNGAGTLAVTANPRRGVSSTVNGIGTLAAAAAARRGVSSILSGAGSIAGAAAVRRGVQAVVAGAGTLTGASTMRAIAAAQLAGAGVLTCSATVDGAVAGDGITERRRRRFERRH